jgi:O-antigen/teichoic acid export membrane protein
LLVRHTYINVVSSVFGGAVGFAVSILVVRVYGIEVVGRIAYMTGLVGLLRFVVDLGIDRAGQKFIAEPEVGFAPEFASYLAIKGVLLAAFLALSAVFFELVFRPDDPLLYLLVTGNLFWISFSDLFTNMLAARRDFTSLAIIRNIARVVMLGFAVLFCTVLQSWYLVAVLPSIEFSVLILLAAPYGFRRLGLSWVRPQWPVCKRYIRFALPISLTEGISLSIANVDKVFVGHLLTDAHVGYLTVAERVYGGFLMIVKAVSQQLLPEISYRLANLKRRVFERQMEKIVRMSSVLGTFLALAVLAYADVLIRTMYGPGLETAAFILRVFSLEILVKLFFRPYHNLVYATERHRIFLWLTPPSQVIRILGTYLLVPLQVAGVTLGGAAKPLAIGVVWIVPRGVGVLYTIRKEFNTLFLSRMGPVASLFLALAALALGLEHLVESRAIMAALGLGVLGLHLVLLRALGVLDDQVLKELTRPLRDAVQALKRKPENAQA